jgi:hypothetical protein
VDGGRHLTSSGWHQWEGKRATNLMMESKESVIQSLKGKLIASTNIMVGYTISKPEVIIIYAYFLKKNVLKHS